MEEDLPPQGEQQPQQRQQQQQSEVVTLLAAMRQQIQQHQQQQIEVLVGRERAREQQTGEDDEELSQRNGETLEGRGRARTRTGMRCRGLRGERGGRMARRGKLLAVVEVPPRAAVVMAEMPYQLWARTKVRLVGSVPVRGRSAAESTGSLGLMTRRQGAYLSLPVLDVVDPQQQQPQLAALAVEIREQEQEELQVREVLSREYEERVQLLAHNHHYNHHRKQQ